MGVPKFFRWATQRYPAILSDVSERGEGGGGQQGAIEFDHLLLDMNGIIHSCSHNSKLTEMPTINKIMEKMEAYVDHLIAIVNPQRSMYIAVDGVAPRAKLNQQRSRRFRSAKERQNALEAEPWRLLGGTEYFDSNAISPGTTLMRDISQRLSQYIEDRIKNHPLWKKIKVIYSGHDVPGEGEHKIEAHIRKMRAEGTPPNQRFCINGQDADMIMLALATHEPYFHVIREKNVDKRNFRRNGKHKKNATGINKSFEFVKINVLRKLIVQELADHPEPIHVPINPERFIDDFIFLTFLVGNDFLPHTPAMRIGDYGFDIIFHAYKSTRVHNPGYLVEKGDVNNVGRLQEIFQIIGLQEDHIIMNNLGLAASMNETFGCYQVAVSEAMENGDFCDVSEDIVVEVMASVDPYCQPDYRRRYYFDKFGILIDTYEGSMELRSIVRSYLQGLKWCLAYYTCGCVSWQWYYPYSYAPFLGDMNDLDQFNSEIQFDLGTPLQPFQQLLSCLPPGSVDLLPSCYHTLMLDDSSPLIEYYPKSFHIDMHGEKQSHLGVVSLPFIDASRLCHVENLYRRLNEEEKHRNSFGTTCVYLAKEYNGDDVDVEMSDALDIKIKRLEVDIQPGTAFKAELLEGTKSWLPGFQDSVRGAHGYKGHHHKDQDKPIFCKYFAEGRCKFAENCRFLHQL